jgi:hypothetical protein
MLFIQPVVMNDAHTDRATPAEVRQAEPRTAEEQPNWTAWAQDSMGGRSPFGPNAPDTNNLTPRPTPASPPSSTVAPPAPVDVNPDDPAATAPRQQTDAGPPGTETGRPGGVPSSDTSGSTTTPVTTPGTGGVTGTSEPREPRLPGASSGASNTQ